MVKLIRIVVIYLTAEHIYLQSSYYINANIHPLNYIKQVNI